MASLSDLARPSTEAPLGGGLAGMARSTVNVDKLYKQYYIEAITQGQEPMSKEEFAAQMANG